MGFKGCHPITNIIFFVSIAVFGLLFKHPVSLAVCFAAALSYYIKLCGKSALKTIGIFIIPMLILVIVINGLFSHYGTTPLMPLPDGNMLTLESVTYGFVLGLAAATIVIWFFCYSEVVTADKFIAVFGKILPAAALVISMALRFVPLYKERFKIISEAQAGIGKDTKAGNIFARIKNGAKNISILITWSLENAIETSDSMKARGYGLHGRISYGKFRWSTRDFILSATIILLDIVMALGYAFKAVYCVYNPYIIINPSADFGKTYYINELNLTVNPLSKMGIVTLAAFAVMCFLPLIIDLREEIKWNRLKSKI